MEIMELCKNCNKIFIKKLLKVENRKKSEIDNEKTSN